MIESSETHFEAGDFRYIARRVTAPGSQRDGEWDILDFSGGWYGSISRDPFSDPPSWRAFCLCDERESDSGTKVRPYTVADSMLIAAQRVALSCAAPDQPTASLEDLT